MTLMADVHPTCVTATTTVEMSTLVSPIKMASSTASTFAKEFDVDPTLNVSARTISPSVLAKKASKATLATFQLAVDRKIFVQLTPTVQVLKFADSTQLVSNTVSTVVKKKFADPTLDVP